MNKRRSYKWMSCHFGIDGNEMGNKYVKIAIPDSNVSLLEVVSYNDMKSYIEANSIQKWHKLWENQSTKLNTIKNSIVRYENPNFKKK